MDFQFIPASYLPWLKKYSNFYHAQFLLLESICYSRNSFKFNIRRFVYGNKNNSVTTKLKLTRADECNLNRTRCDLIFKEHFFTHNFIRVPDPSCGFRNQSTKHLFFQCPLLNDIRQELFHDLVLLPMFAIFNLFHRMDEKLHALLFCHSAFTPETAKQVVERVAGFITSTLEVVRPME
jgi:uncharacterized membrane protein YbaN (DUF454 family)